MTDSKIIIYRPYHTVAMFLTVRTVSTANVNVLGCMYICMYINVHMYVHFMYVHTVHVRISLIF